MGGVTLPDGSHPICLCLCLFPGSNAAVHQVIVAAGDGVLGSHMSFVVVVNYRARSVLQEWNFFNWHAEPPVLLSHSIYIDDSVRAPYRVGAKRWAVGKLGPPAGWSVHLCSQLNHFGGGFVAQ